MKMKGFKITISCLIVTSLLSYLFSEEGKAQDKGKYGGALKIGVTVPQYDKIDVRYATSKSIGPSFNMIYETLFGWGKGGFSDLRPVLASGYETKDNKVWIIYLKKGVKFHNGREVTAEDVKTNLDWAISTPPGWKPVRFSEYIKCMKKVDVIDRYTIRITLDKPFFPFIRILTMAVRGIAPPEEVQKWGDQFNFHATGTGPFKIKDIRPERIILERFDQYWGPKPYLDQVIYIPIRSDEARLIALQTGDIDMAHLYDEARPNLEKDPNLTYVPVINTEVQIKIYFNMRRWPMNDIRFRKAVAMGADWRAIAANSSAYKSAIPFLTYLDRTVWKNEEAEKLLLPYSPEEAREMIKEVEKEAGKKVPPIFWLDSNAAPQVRTAEMAQGQLSLVGIKLDLNLLSQAIWYEKLLRNPKIEWDMGGYAMGPAVDPMNSFNTFATDSKVGADGKSLGGYSNPEFDKWLTKAESALNFGDCKKAYQEAEKILLKDIPAICLYPNRYLVAYNKKVKGFIATDEGGIIVTSFWNNIWIEK